MLDTDQFKTRLLTRLAELGDKVKKAEHELDQPGDPDTEEQAATRQGDEVVEELEEAALAEIKQVRTALARISSGQFGHCAACGGPISEKRLEAVPHADKCISCA